MEPDPLIDGFFSAGSINFKNKNTDLTMFMLLHLAQTTKIETYFTDMSIVVEITDHT